MNHHSNVTTMMNIQNSDILMSNDRFHDTREINKSNDNFKTQDSTILQEISMLFSQFQQSDVNVKQTVFAIYTLSLKVVFKPRISNFFADNFPFEPFLRIILAPPSPEIQSYAFVCLASACQSSNFPYQLFANSDILLFLVSALCSEDPNVVDSSLQLLTAVSKLSIDSRDFLLQNDIITKMTQMKLTFSIAELLESLCCSSPPPSPPFIPSIANFIAHLIDGSPTQIFQLGLSSLLSLLINHAEGIIADEFQQFLMPIFLSEMTSIVPLGLKILLFVNNPEPDFAITLLNILEGNGFENLMNNPTVLFLITKIFAHFEPIWRPLVQDKLFLLLESKIGATRYKVDSEIIQTMILYYDARHVNDLNFFNNLLRFADSAEIGCKCMKQLLLMIQSPCSQDVHEKMMELLDQSLSTFTGLMNGEDDDLAVHADELLSQIEQMGNQI
ncbi:hypothetical protein TRFO_20422 [Tritrichomonas foetus]|uniref:Uncharacterized protein n=1 Tax=Tritrichomonas foetus TaxID=1144522 RepID=A0A1J4KH52_9EUKA|nr:hypothetical protein TRFO_20422 [Tritrichomonas foetus]|eukprot:OHT10370.1 hypothetical protein TRFO_20422 [Tritrichomonas foetus]